VLKKNGNFPFDSQCIPTDKALLEVGAYKEFLEARRALISDRLNAFPGIPASGATPAGPRVGLL
jgi:hypothetical protein